MKQPLLYGIVISSFLLFSCSKEEISNNITESGDFNVITLESVKLNDFSSDTSSRASYTQDAATVFEQDDKLGLILLDAKDNRIDHISYSYISAENRWNLDDQTKYYSSKIKKIIAYFPYNSSLSTEINTVDKLKNTISISTDQSDQDTFKSCDLLVEEINSPSQKLTVNLGHAFSLIEFQSEPMTLQANNKSYEYNVELQNVKMVIGETDYQLCNINGTYSLLVKDGFTVPADDFRYFYSLGDDSYVKTLTTAKTTESGKKYVFPCKVKDGYKPEYAAGDFYCTDNENENVVIVPRVATTIPEGLTCKGIVFHVMDANEWGTFTSNNDLTADNLSGYDGNHGLVISIANGNPFGTMTVDYLKSSVFNNILEIAGNLTTFTGYKLTQTLKNFTESAEFKFSALDNFKESIQNTTSWYVPSFYELSLIYDDIDYLNSQISNKIEGGVTIDAKMPTVSFDSDDNALNGFIVIENGNNVWAGIPDENIRPIFAF